MQKDMKTGAADKVKIDGGGVKKKRVKKRRKIAKIPSLARLPTGKDDASSNWKALINELQSEQLQKPKKVIGTFRKAKRKEAKEAFKKGDQNKKTETKKAKPEIWFDDVDEMLLDQEDREQSAVSANRPSTSGTGKTSALVKERSFKG
jgi:hypothetical protein